MWLGIFVAVSYGVVAVAANFVNKYAIQVLPLPTTILLFQTVTTVVVLRMLATLRVIRLPSLWALRFHQVSPLAACYCVHAILVLYSLAFLSVPMYNVLKRLTPVIVLTIKAATERRWPDAQTTLSVLLIVSGCLVAGAGDFSFDAKGYTLALVCAMAQATYILLAEKAGGSSGQGSAAVSRRKHHVSETNLPDIESKATEVRSGSGPGYGSKQDLAHSTGVAVHAHAASTRLSQAVTAVCQPLFAAAPKAGVGMGSTAVQPAGVQAGMGAMGGSASDNWAPLSAVELLYSIFCIALPALAAMCMVTGESARAPALLVGLRKGMGGPSFALWLGITAVTEGLLTGSLILCAQLNSALTTSIVGVLKGAVSSVMGFFLLGGVKFHALNVTGIGMNMVGGAWYSARQYFSSAR